MPQSKKKKRPPKRVLALPDLEPSKNGGPEQFARFLYFPGTSPNNVFTGSTR
jgi:hypothetical protein